jgi:hypothetical protein
MARMVRDEQLCARQPAPDRATQRAGQLAQLLREPVAQGEILEAKMPAFREAERL